MQLGIKNSQQITQTLNIQLMQHLEILRFSNNELEQYIYEKGNENPLLIVEDAKIKNASDDIMKLAFSSYNSNIKNVSYDTNQQFDFIEMKAKQIDSYVDFLFEQIPLHQSLNQTDFKILTYLIQSLDEHFFLDIDLESVANHFKTSNSHVENLLNLLQTFEPVGIGARNSKEYLLIQIKNDLFSPKMAATFVSSDLELVSTHSFKQLSRKYKLPIEEVKDTIDYIKELRPIPVVTAGMLEPISYVIPDAEVKKYENEWIIQLNRHYLPSISINESYVNLLKKDPNYKSYYKHSMQDALALIQGIELRDKTLYELIKSLLNTQEDFFTHGMSALKPMLLKDAAKKLNVHQSTISRAIRCKYIQTPHGIYSLHSLFTKGITNESGKVDSIVHIKQLIKKLIENENKQKPLTDQQIAELLCADNIRISRRTVAKYREELHIVSSFNRAHM